MRLIIRACKSRKFLSVGQMLNDFILSIEVTLLNKKKENEKIST